MTYSLKNLELWIYPAGEGAWYFVTIPKDVSEEISTNHEDKKAGFGSLKVNVQIGKSEWKTSIFPDKKSSTFFLPIKKEIRKNERLDIGRSLDLLLTVD